MDRQGGGNRVSETWKAGNMGEGKEETQETKVLGDTPQNLGDSP